MKFISDVYGKQVPSGFADDGRNRFQYTIRLEGLDDEVF